MLNPEIKGILKKEAKVYLTSPSHDEEHLERVLSNALNLQKIYGGDPEIITAAVMLHDLARTNTQLIGRDSALESANLARPILEKVDFPEEKIALVCEAIEQHDLPEIIPGTIEGKILKEADFLDGFGARGIWRSLLWSGERGECSEEIIRRFKEKMPARIDSLIFPESREIARKQYRFVELFLALLEHPTSLEVEALEGKYIVFEGISGSGKETQARKLISEIETRGIQAQLIFEPTPDVKPILSEWRKDVDDHTMELFLFIADRKRLIERDVLPAMRSGKTVIGVRSYISTLIYQTKNDLEIAQVSYLHTFVPDPDLIILVDIDEEEALERIWKRSGTTGEPIGKFEKEDKLKRHREKYNEVLKRFDNVVRIDGMQSKELVHQEIIEAIEQQGIWNKSKKSSTS